MVCIYHLFRHRAGIEKPERALEHVVLSGFANTFNL